jgi:prephenate dehydrogenase
MAAGIWPPRRLGVVGLGLIGGSVAMAARQSWPGIAILGADRPGPDDHAIEEALVDRIVPVAGLAACDLIVLAAPVTANITLLSDLSALGCRALVTDVGGTKRAMARAADELPIGLRFVGGHPMAGNETGVPVADLFRGCAWFVVSGGRAIERDVACIESFAEALGARPLRFDAEAHDQIMAAVSHVPQLVASVLMEAVGERVGREGLAHAGRGLADTTRLASCPGDWLPAVLATNQDHVGDVLDDVIARLQAIRSQLSSSADITTMLTSARAWREALLASRRRE